MRSTVARRLRKAIYGEDMAPRARKYRAVISKIWRDLKGNKQESVQLKSDPYRSGFKLMKRNHRGHPPTSKLRASRRWVKAWKKRRAQQKAQ